MIPKICYYMLDDQKRIIEVDSNDKEKMINWIIWYEDFNNRIVGKTKITDAEMIRYYLKL